MGPSDDEASVVLCMCYQWFRGAVCHNDIMSESLIDLLFGCVSPLCDFHSAFLKQIEQRLTSWLVVSLSPVNIYSDNNLTIMRGKLVHLSFMSYLSSTLYVARLLTPTTAFDSLGLRSVCAKLVHHLSSSAT